MTVSQWNEINYFLREMSGDPGRSGEDNRLLVNAVLCVAKTGTPWRDLPERFGHWNSVWGRFARWCKNGSWRTIAKQLDEELQLDSTSFKVHLAAVGGRRGKKEKVTMQRAVPVVAALAEV